MSDLIQWPRAKYWTAQWNPIIGCKPCSPACDNCYARAWAARFHKSFAPTPSTRKRPPRSGICFCGNMTDLFGGWNWRCDMAERIGQCVNRGATAYLWLTKRVYEMCYVLAHEKVLLTPFGCDEDSAEWFSFNAPGCNLANHYFGFTAEDQYWFYERMLTLVHYIPSLIKSWVSAEPLLGPIHMPFYQYWHLPSWVVVGCESGPHRRPCKLEWVESIVEQCMAARVPVFVKQLDIGGKCVTDISKFPAHLQIRQVPWKTTREENKQ